MKRSGHDDNVSGVVVKTDDKSTLHCELIKSIKMQTCFNQNGV